MGFTPESSRGLQAGVAPAAMQMQYDTEQAKRAGLLNNLQGFGVQGQQNTIPSIQQLNTPQSEILNRIAADKIYNAPAAIEERKRTAMAADNAAALQRKEVYKQWLASEAGQTATQSKDTGMFSGWFK